MRISDWSSDVCSSDLFLSDGKIGAVDAATGSVTDGAAAIFNGRAAAGAANSFKGTNNGLIAGGLRTVGFGGDASITNGGEIYNGITASGQGNVSKKTSAAGGVRSAKRSGGKECVSTCRSRRSRTNRKNKTLQ